MRFTWLLVSSLALAACNGAPDSATNENSAAMGDQNNDAGSTTGEAATGDVSGEEAPPESEPSATTNVEESGVAFTNTAWRVTGEDGAIYTTFFDPENAYRDMKNGEPWAEGTWERLADGRLCFTPADEGRAGDCWNLGKEDDAGNMRVTNGTGREVLLQQVTYIAPLEQ